MVENINTVQSSCAFFRSRLFWMPSREMSINDLVYIGSHMHRNKAIINAVTRQLEATDFQ